MTIDELRVLASDVADLQFQVVSYRQCLSIALEMMHTQNKRVRSLEEQLGALREELRRYTAAKVA